MKAVIAGLSMLHPFIHLGSLWNRHREEVEHQRRVSLFKRILLIGIAVFFVLLLLAGVTKALLSVNGITLQRVANVAGTDLPQDEDGFTNVLLLGQGDEGHDGKDLTDTVIVASIDPKETKSVVLLSLPRDLYFLHTEKMGAGKLNSFYRDYKYYLKSQGSPDEEATLGAMHELGDEVGRALDMEIHHVVKADFTGFIKAVDLIGGIDIEVPEDINDAAYPDESYGYEPFSIKAGPRHLDGATALKYARSRSTTSDFDRSARQQQIIAAVADKAKQSGVLGNASSVGSFLKILSENVKTTMSLREIIGAAGLGEDLDRSRLVTMQLNNRNGLFDGLAEPGGFLYDPPRDLFEGAAVMLPVSIPEFPVTWKQIQALRRLLFGERTIYLERPGVAVLNAGAPEGTARRLATEFVRYGFNVELVENADSGKRETSAILSGPEPSAAVDFFAGLLKLPVEPVPENLPVEQRQPVTILLGKDARYVPIQDLLAEPDTPPS